MAKSLIAFYSRADENYVSGQLKMLKVGNTEKVAHILQKLTGADLFKIEQTEPYSRGYNDCIEQARDDQRRNARPKLKEYPESLNEYDEIYLCYPNYWGTMPMAVFTFLGKYDFSGKKIYPLCTHEGSGMGSSERDIKRVCPTAILGGGLAVKGSSAENSASAVESWLKKLDK